MKRRIVGILCINCAGKVATAEGLIRSLGPRPLEPTRVLGTVNAVPVQPKSAFQAVAEPTRYQGGSCYDRALT